MTEPVTLAFDLDCSVEHAFAVWTERIDTWWPPDHTATGRLDVEVVFGAGVGERIYERSADGIEYEWGQVTAWQPPRRLAYLWYLGREPSDATEVEVRFVAQDSGATRVEIEHRGWEKWGASADLWRDRNQLGWQTVMPHYLRAITQSVDR